MSSEASIYRAILREIGRVYGRDARVLKMHGNEFTGPGLQDLVGVIRGRAVAIEVKRPGEEPEPIQAHEIKLWKRAGAITGCAHSVAEAMQLIDDGLQEGCSWL